MGLRVDIGPTLDESANLLEVAGSPMECGPPVSIGVVRGRASLEEETDESCVGPERGERERRLAIFPRARSISGSLSRMRDTAAESPVRIASRSSPEIGAGEGAAASSPATRDAKREVSATQTIHADDLKHATERHLERWERRNPAGNRPDSIAGGWILSADPHARRATFAGVFQDLG